MEAAAAVKDDTHILSIYDASSRLALVQSNHRSKGGTAGDYEDGSTSKSKMQRIWYYAR